MVIYFCLLEIRDHELHTFAKRASIIVFVQLDNKLLNAS